MLRLHKQTLLRIATVPLLVLSLIFAAAASGASPQEQQQQQQGAHGNTDNYNHNKQLYAQWEEKSNHLPCWRQAFLDLKHSCQTMAASKALRQDLAARLMRCQLLLDGRADDAATITISDHSGSGSGTSPAASISRELYPIFISFSNSVDSLCFHIQHDVIQHKNVQLLDRLGSAGLHAATKLEHVDEKVAAIAGSVQAAENANRALQQSISVLANDHVRSVGDIAAQLGEAHTTLRNLANLNRRTQNFVGSLDAVIYYASVTALLLVTTSPAITQDARLPAILCGVIGSLVAEKYFATPLLWILSFFVTATPSSLSSADASSSSIASSAAPNDHLLLHHHPEPIRNLALLIAIMSIVYHAWHYESPEARQHKLLREALNSAISMTYRVKSPRIAASPPRLVVTAGASGGKEESNNTNSNNNDSTSVGDRKTISSRVEELPSSSGGEGAEQQQESSPSPSSPAATCGAAAASAARRTRSSKKTKK